MKNIIIGLAALTSLAISNPIQEREIFLNINEENLQVGYESEPLGSVITSNKLFRYDGSYLNGEEIHVLTASLKNVNNIERIKGSELGIGIEGVYLNYFDEDFLFLPLTVSFKYSFPALMYNIPPVSTDTKLSYAPKALSFNENSENYFSTSIEGNIEPIRDVKIYIGYRNVNSKNLMNKDSILNEAYAGLKMNF